MKSLKISRQQGGLASIIIVFMLTVIISLLTLGFSRLMDRAIQQSTGNDLNAAADYAVRVGISEAASYLKAFPDTPAKTCDELTKEGKPLSRAGGLSGDDNVKYTCVLINTSPADIFYQMAQPYKSQISKLKPDNNMDQMMISWQSGDRTKNLYPLPGSALYDETMWDKKGYPAVLRLTLYPFTGKENSKSAWISLKANARTVFLYPSSTNPQGNPSAQITRIDWKVLSDGARFSTNCGTTKTDASPPAPAFVGKTDFDCNVIFFNLPAQAGGPAPTFFYARITPLYVAGTNVRIQGQSGSQLVNFGGTQSIVDVTAKAGNSAKRLQARVDIIPTEFVDPQLRPSEDAAPEFAVRSADTICKIFVVPPSKSTEVSIPANITGAPYADACPTVYE